MRSFWNRVRIPYFFHASDYRFKMRSYADNHGTLGISDLLGMRKKLSISSHWTHWSKTIVVVTKYKYFFLISNFNAENSFNFTMQIKIARFARNVEKMILFYNFVYIVIVVQSPPFKEPRKYVRTHQKKPKEIFQIFQQAQRILEFFPMWGASCCCWKNERWVEEH